MTGRGRGGWRNRRVPGCGVQGRSRSHGSQVHCRDGGHSQGCGIVHGKEDAVAVKVLVALVRQAGGTWLSAPKGGSWLVRPWEPTQPDGPVRGSCRVRPVRRVVCHRSDRKNSLGFPDRGEHLVGWSSGRCLIGRTAESYTPTKRIVLNDYISCPTVESYTSSQTIKMIALNSHNKLKLVASVAKLSRWIMAISIIILGKISLYLIYIYR